MSLSFKELLVIRKAKTLVFDTYRITERLPQSEKFNLISQMNRAAVSVVSNLAEGSQRTPKEFIHFINISRGSLSELMIQMDLARELYQDHIDNDNLELFDLQAEEIGKMTYGLLNRLKTQTDNSNSSRGGAK